MKAVVEQPLIGQPLQRGRVRRTTERARLTKTDIVEQHQQDVGCTARRGRQFNEVSLGIDVRISDPASKPRRGRWQDVRNRCLAGLFAGRGKK